MQRKIFTRELRELYDMLIKMGVMTEIAMNEVVKSIESKDIDLAQKIIDGDDLIDDMERQIEKHCVELLVKQSPVAKDIRMVTSIMKMTTDIERIADHASDISEIVVKIAPEDYVWDISVLVRMTDFAKQMIKDALKSFIEGDISLAEMVIKSDEQVNALYDRALEELEDIMKKSPDNIRQGMAFLSIAKYLERVGDHATNIAEWVKYNVTGEFA